MRGCTARLSNEAKKTMATQNKHIGGRDVFGYKNPSPVVFMVVFTNDLFKANLSLHRPKDSVDDLLNIGLALTQVGVFNFVKLGRDGFKLLQQTPLGIAAVVLYALLGGSDQ